MQTDVSLRRKKGGENAEKKPEKARENEKRFEKVPKMLNNGSKNTQKSAKSNTKNIFTPVKSACWRVHINLCRQLISHFLRHRPQQLLYIIPTTTCNRINIRRRIHLRLISNPIQRTIPKLATYLHTILYKLRT